MRKISAIVCAGINVLRCFPDKEINAFLVTYDQDDPALASRYYDRFKVLSQFTSDEDILEEFIELGKTFDEKPVLFYGDDRLLLLISRNREKFAEYYRFLMPSSELIEGFVDKSEFHDLASRFDLPVPRTVLSRQVNTVEEIKEHLSPPYLIKPSTHIGWHQSEIVKKETKGQPQKALIAESDNDLKRLYEMILKVTNDFVIQEFIPGGEDLIYSFHAYYDADSRPLAYFVGKKIRTYPRVGGESCAIELVKEDEVIELGLDILKKMKFVGPVKLDFKKDIHRNKYYLLEINARYNLWHYLGSVAGINIPRIAYTYMTEKKVTLQKDYIPGIKWIAFGMDFRSFIKSYYPSGELSWLGWLSSYKGKKVYSFFSWSDPYPFFFTIYKYIKAKIPGKKR